jgi:hypothetical protein
LPLYCCKRKAQPRRKNIKNFTDNNKVWWTNKKFLAKPASTTNPNKEQITVFVLVYQKIGFVNVNPIAKETQFLMAQKQGWKLWSVGTQNVDMNFNSMRWAAKLNSFKDTETMTQKKGEKKLDTGNPIVRRCFMENKKIDTRYKMNRKRTLFLITIIIPNRTTKPFLYGNILNSIER